MLFPEIWPRSLAGVLNGGLWNLRKAPSTHGPCAFDLKIPEHGEGRL